MIHYVYRITNTKINKHYYGCRSTKINPENDLGFRYFSSSTNNVFIQEQRTNPTIFKYKILKTFNDRIDALKFEIFLHQKFNVGVNDKFYNKCMQGISTLNTSNQIGINGKLVSCEYYKSHKSENFKHHNTNKVTVISSSYETSQVDITHPQYLSRKLKSVQCNMVNSINENGQTEWVTVDDYYIRKLTCNNTNKVPVYDENGKGMLITKQKFQLSANYTHVSKNIVQAYDTTTKKYTSIPKTVFDSNTKYVGVNKGKISGAKNPNAKTINIYDKCGVLKYECIGDFEKICKAYNLPFMSLKRSYMKHTKIYQGYNIPTNKLKYIGWYARKTP